MNSALVFSLLVTNNVLLTNGFGALGLQRNKDNTLFTFLNAILVAVGTLVCAVLYNVIYTYLLDPYNVEKLGVLIIVVLAGAINFATLGILKASNKEMYYYYDTTYSYVINMGLTIGILFCISPLLSLIDCLITAAFIGLSYVLTSMLFAFVYNRLHSRRISRMIRPVPITILTMAVLSMIIYAISISF